MKKCGLSFFILTTLPILFIFHSPLFAQYKVYTWENFENGAFPTSLLFYGDSNINNVFLVRYEQLPNSAQIMEGIAKSECGNYGLCFKTGPSSRYLRVVGNNILKRDLLQDQYKAIVQADFYLQKPSEEMVGMALLAAEISPLHTGKITTYYRLGINRLGQIYFSFIDNRIQERPLYYVKDEVKRFKLKTPGWHRFQMVFQGQSAIRCYVNGTEADFSPITETSLKTIGMGVMVAAQPNQTMISVIDNLSIQLAEEDLPLPDSPWVEEEIINNSPFRNQVSHIPASTMPDLYWHRSSEQAVQSNLQLKKPYLVLFFSPFVKTNASLNQIITSDLGARNYLKQFVLVCVDVNQLGGGTLAQKFGIFKLPCIMTLDFNGNEISRVYFTDEMDWKTVEQKLNVVKK